MPDPPHGAASGVVLRLYARAVDACREGRARRRALGLPPERFDDDHPEIEFVEGRVGGRLFVECIDRGAGSTAAGLRAAFGPTDPALTAFLEIASSVSVTTSPLDRDGAVRVGSAVHLSAVSTALEVVPAETSGTRHGTRVRLWLKRDVRLSAAAVLRDLVIVCPVHMRVQDDRGAVSRWAPGELSQLSENLHHLGKSVATAERVWWTQGSGGVVARGLWCDRPLVGLVVEATAPFTRESDGAAVDGSSIDRNGIDENAIDGREIDERVTRAASLTTERAWSIVGEPNWIDVMSRRFPAAADAIVEGAVTSGRTIALHGVEVPITATGFVAGDEDLAPLRPDAGILDWRFSRCRAAGLYRGLGIPASPESPIVRALPSDAVLLGTVPYRYRFGSAHRVSPWQGTAASIYDAERLLGFSMTHLVDRCRMLGLSLPEEVDQLPASTDTVRAALSFSTRQTLTGANRPLCAFDVLRASWSRNLPIARVQSDLLEHGIELQPSAARLDEGVRPGVLVAASLALDGQAPWLRVSQRIGPGRLQAAAAASRLTIDEIVEGLTRLGFENLHVVERTDESADADDALAPGEHAQWSGTIDGLSRSDRQLLSVDAEGAPPWHDARTPIPAWYVATHALRRGSIEAVTDDYRRLGYRVHDPVDAPVTRSPGQSEYA